ncbi:glycosyltransferase [Clostridium aquiflavi]|uniref:Glycosyltransferase n=1 Tax=Clostridium aquiflavi TaxID=3073603 RepID=A0ABU1EJM0_9CLOT|nr:glycosyltransferase [Clostridium sp. 5N-1]MDR5588257.1 glycosyltransferase [Clostridium sp. 5N-1]
MKVDIVIPIYNAYEYTVECVNSVIRHTNEEDYNLILINDKSPDKRVGEYLDKLGKENHENILISHNEKNIGFVGTVNKGMSISKNDIVLLNSDTEVTRNWLSKIKNVAYSNCNIATVTPLTNSGTICSIPIFCQDNQIPENFTVDEYADVIEKISLKIYPSIPTAVGFCMYIKRSVINKIGLFDEETFGRGYGEENDFCCKALENGYYHVLCDDTFIYHKGSASFSADKNELVKKNSKLLFERYPYYTKMIEKFILKNPLKEIQNNIKLQITIRNKKRNILYVVHNDFLTGENHPIGGTEFHVKDLVDNIKLFNSYVMIVKDNTIKIHAFIDERILKFSYQLSDVIDTFNFSSNSYIEKLNEIIDYFNIDVVHIQHLKTHTFDVVDIAKKKDIPVFLTIHDFYLNCPNINLLYFNKTYCINNRSKENCISCIKNNYGYDGYFLGVWNEKVYEMLKRIDKIFAPSNAAKKIFEQYYIDKYGKIEFEIKVIEHGIDEKKELKRNYLDNKDDKFKIAFVGGLSRTKGSKLIHDIIKNNKNKNVEWHLFGNIGDQRLNLLDKKEVIKHGRYNRNEIEKILNENNINLICIFSICPETYSYTLSESIIANIPILVTDIGALGERVDKYDIGWKIRYDSTYKEVLEKIEEIIKNKNTYIEKCSNIKNVKLPNKQEIAKYYEEFYLVKAKSKLNQIDSIEVKNTLLNYRINNIDEFSSNCENNAIVINELNRSIDQLQNEVSLMKATLGWKVMEYIRNTIPDSIKHIGKKTVYFFSRFMIK